MHTTILLALASLASAQEAGGPPRRQIPASVLAELAELEGRFDLAVAVDCDQERCFSRGCTYVGHAVSDRPQAASLPGLGDEMGPGSVEPQAWLTKASCSFAYEESMEPADVQALARRLQTKVSKGWTVVSVGSQALPALPAYLQEPPEPLEGGEEPEPAPPPPPEPWTTASAARELWTTLLDDFPWMIAVVLSTVAATALIWAWRRVGREAFDELPAELPPAAGDDLAEARADEPSPSADEETARKAAAWRLRLAAADRDPPDHELQTMIRDLLRAGELPLLAKAVLTFPETLPKRFPSGGDVAAAKLELAEFLKTADPASLPSDADLFRALDRHALSAGLASQPDAEIVRSLREEFGASGLVALLQSVPARAGALLFALAPAEAQHEVVRMLPPPLMAAMAEQLLRSNRMDLHETAHLFEVLEAARSGAPMPAAPPSDEVSDHGAPFDATAALSLLLAKVTPTDRAALLGWSLQRSGGSLPGWYQGVLLPDMLLELSDEERTDLLLAIEAEPLAAWLSLLEPEIGERLLGQSPGSLRASIAAASVFPSRTRQLALADRGRRELARGLQAQLARGRVPFEQVVRALAGRGK